MDVLLIKPLKAKFSSVHSYFTKLLSSSPETNLSTSPNNDFGINIDHHDEEDGSDDLDNNNQATASEYWGKMIIQFCFGAAIGLVGLSFQQIQPQQITLSFKLLYVFVLLAFSTSLGGILLRLKYPFAAKVLETMGIMFASIVFFLAMDITIVPHCKSLHFVTWFICAISLILIFFHSIYAYVV